MGGSPEPAPEGSPRLSPRGRCGVAVCFPAGRWGTVSAPSCTGPRDGMLLPGTGPDGALLTAGHLHMTS